MPKKKRAAKKKAEPTIQERAQKYIQEDIKLMEKHYLNKRVVVEFPKRAGGKPPMLGRLAMYLLRKSGGVISVQFVDMKR